MHLQYGRSPACFTWNIQLSVFCIVQSEKHSAYFQEAKYTAYCVSLSSNTKHIFNHSDTKGMMCFNLIIKIPNMLFAIFKKQNVHSVWSSLAPIFNNQLWPSSPVPVGPTLHSPTSGLPTKPWCDSTWQPQTTSVWNWRIFFQENCLAGVRHKDCKSSWWELPRHVQDRRQYFPFKHRLLYC